MEHGYGDHSEDGDYSPRRDGGNVETGGKCIARYLEDRRGEPRRQVGDCYGRAAEGVAGGAIGGDVPAPACPTSVDHSAGDVDLGPRHCGAPAGGEERCTFATS